MTKFKDYTDLQYIVTEKSITSASVLDIFDDKFDVTWAFAQEYREILDLGQPLTILPGEKIIGDKPDDGSIIYKYNSDYYRCDNFTSKHDSKYHVLFGGCSESEGMGGNIEDVWTHQLHTELKDKYDIGGFYSIARAGYGWQKIISNFMIYEKKYGTPTHYFVMMPNLVRKFYWLQDMDKWMYDQKWAELEPPIDDNGRLGHVDDSEKKYTTVEEHRIELANFAVSWKLFEAYCKSKNVKLIWSTWNYPENQNFKRMQFKNFLEINPNDLPIFLLHKYGNLKIQNNDIEKRDGHSGVKINRFWTSFFLNEIENKGVFSD